MSDKLKAAAGRMAQEMTDSIYMLPKGEKGDPAKMRYVYVPYSQSAHCCFEATVLDASKPQIIGKEHYLGSDGYYHYDPLCECFNETDAVRICEALNAKAHHDAKEPTEV